MTTQNSQQQVAVSNQVTTMAKRLNVDPVEMQNIILSTVMPTGQNQKPVTNEQFVSFLAVANEYRLNPLTKEIYAFPAKGGGIQPIVSIDGWLKIINGHPDFNGMVFEDIRENGELVAVTCKIYKKGIEHPVTVTEYMDECKGTSDPWKRWPARMLRHKAAIQGGRYAFGLSGIIDPDEADRFEQQGVIEQPKELLEYTEEQFMKNFSGWKEAVESGKKTPDELVSMIQSKYTLPENMRSSIMNINAIDAQVTE